MTTRQTVLITTIPPCVYIINMGFALQKKPNSIQHAQCLSTENIKFYKSDAMNKVSITAYPVAPFNLVFPMEAEAYQLCSGSINFLSHNCAACFQRLKEELNDILLASNYSRLLLQCDVL